jgi:hypothetical protein
MVAASTSGEHPMARTLTPIAGRTQAATLSLPQAIVLGGLVGGALDLLFAVVFGAVRGVAAGRVLQSVASGLLGRAAYDGGTATALLGVACHFVLSLGWAALLAAACVRIPRLLRHPAWTGIAFGALVFLAMRLVVLPLSAYPAPVAFRPLASTLDLASHLFLFGMPIALALARVRRFAGASLRESPNPGAAAAGINRKGTSP